MQELIRLNQAAERLGVHVTTVRAWVRDGRVPAYRLGQRFTRVDWNELLTAITITNHDNLPASSCQSEDRHGR